MQRLKSFFNEGTIVVLITLGLIACQGEQQPAPEVKDGSTVVSYDAIHALPVPVDDESGPIVRSYFTKESKLKIDVYADGTEKTVVSFDRIKKDNGVDAFSTSSSCAGGGHRVCIRCGGKKVLCVDGIPDGCSVMAGDKCMEIDCSAGGCPSYNVCCDDYFR